MDLCSWCGHMLWLSCRISNGVFIFTLGVLVCIWVSSWKCNTKYFCSQKRVEGSIHGEMTSDSTRHSFPWHNVADCVASIGHLHAARLLTHSLSSGAQCFRESSFQYVNLLDVRSLSTAQSSVQGRRSVAKTGGVQMRTPARSKIYVSRAAARYPTLRWTRNPRALHYGIVVGQSRSMPHAL